MAEENKTQENEQQFLIQRVYVKDLSFEIPDAPEVFKQEWKPKLSLDLNVENSLVMDDVHEVILSVTATIENNEKTAFLIEVKQAGIFTIKGAEEEQLQQLLGSFCPNVLFPYAREVITDMASRGSFPQLILAPVNFDALYARQMQEKAAADKNTGTDN